MTCSFATSCYEGDWEHVLLKKDYLKKLQIENHNYPFFERILVINNVSNLEVVKEAAREHVNNGTLTRYVIAKEEILSRFQLKKSDFNLGKDAEKYRVTNPDWVFFNALAPLTAIYTCKSPYLLYQTGDVYLKKKISWIEKAIAFMEKNSQVGVANLTWNGNYKEAKKESTSKTWNFYLADEGFSDQQFLVNTTLFQKPIYGEIRKDSAHFPRGDVFEKRVFSFFKNHGFKRIIYRRGSYTHENI